MNLIVAVDGPAGAGKGTIAKKVSEILNLTYIDTGALFRCVTLNLIEENISLKDEEKISQILNNIKIDLKTNGEVYLNSKDVTHKIREKEVNNTVPLVSKIPIVREKLTIIEKNFANNHDIIMEGRDIGTSVFPNAQVKIYLDATPEERAKRRLKQNEEKNIPCNYEEVLEGIIKRDKEDSTRETSPLTKADDAIYIDSSNMTIDEVVDYIVKIIKEKTN